MLLNTETKTIQEKLAGYCRTGEPVEIPGVKHDRLHNYRRLVFNVINSTIQQAYPITREWLPDEEWQYLVNEFFKKHDAQTPQVWKLPFEFYQFISNNHYADELNKPALNDLLWFEWLEIEVHTMPDQIIPDYRSKGNLSSDKLVINPHLVLTKLTYPIHKMGGNEAALHEGLYFILIYRQKDTGNVRFMEISALHVFVIEELLKSPWSIEQLLPDISSLFGLDDYQTLSQHLFHFCSDILDKQILLGYTN
ncbi:hypothetical protein DMA11_07125 [Marinilabiliaceae bacterium JC017]|nr:hypothetical protein DMA11_07125 [Marinilabiliaceae bacterium JC017]